VERFGQTCSVSNVCQLFQEQTRKDVKQMSRHLSVFDESTLVAEPVPPGLATSGSAQLLDKLAAYSHIKMWIIVAPEYCKRSSSTSEAINIVELWYVLTTS